MTEPASEPQPELQSEPQPEPQPEPQSELPSTAAGLDGADPTQELALWPPEQAERRGEGQPLRPEQPGQSAQPGRSEQSARPGRYRLAFRGWRHTRPFWGGLLVLLGGGEILLTYRASFGIVLHFGLYGLAGYLVPAMLVLLGALIIFDPVHRTFYSVLAVLAALGTWLTSNLGGFFLGMLLGLIGGSMAFGWQYGERPARKRRRVRSRTRARAAE